MINFNDKFIIEMSGGKYKTWNEINSLAIEKGIYFQENFSIGMSNPSDSDLNNFLNDSFPLILEKQLLEGETLNIKNIYNYYQNVWLSKEECEIYEIVANLFKYFCEINGSTTEELKKTNDIQFIIEKTIKLAKNIPENTVYDQTKYNDLIELSNIYNPNKK